MRYVLLLLVAIAIAGVAAQSQPPAPSGREVGTPEEQQTASAQNKSTIEREPIVVRVEQIQNAQSAKSDDAEYRKNESSYDGLLALFTGLLVLIGAIQAAIFVMHTWYFRSGEDTKRKELRAYVSVQVHKLLAVPGEGDNPPKHFEAHPIIQNTGRTPAKNCIFVAKMETHAAYPRDHDYSLPIGDNPSVTTIAPGQGNFIPVYDSVIYTTEQIGVIKKPGDPRLFLYGTVFYTDVFGEKHWTNFCYYAMWGDKGIPIWFATRDHNDAK